MNTLADARLSLREGIAELQKDIAFLQASPGGEKCLEADEAVIRHIWPAGVGDAGYIFWQGVKIYQKGRREEADKRDALKSEEILFGK